MAIEELVLLQGSRGWPQTDGWCCTCARQPRIDEATRMRTEVRWEVRSWQVCIRVLPARGYPLFHQ